MNRAVGAVLLPTEDTPVVRAAGGVIVQPDAGLHWRVALVHRPHREDWTFPKGKLEPDESFEECALREVEEETGLECRLGRFVGHTEYRDRKDRHKVVAYWLMRTVGGTFGPNDEVDQLVWADLDEAAERLSYERDRELLLVVAGMEGLPEIA